jgi:hypothetical protein
MICCSSLHLLLKQLRTKTFVTKYIRNRLIHRQYLFDFLESSI